MNTINQWFELKTAAADFLAVIENITTEDFRLGGDSAERLRLRAVLDSMTEAIQGDPGKVLSAVRDIQRLALAIQAGKIDPGPGSMAILHKADFIALLFGVGGET